MLNTIFIIIYSFLVKLISSLASPIFSDECFQADNVVFYYVGRELLSGKILYKDLMDNKSPYIFLLNAIAYLISYKHIGLYIIESILLSLTLYYVYEIILFFLNDKIKSLVGTILFSILLCNAYITLGMSKTECYMLPFTMGVMYYAIDILSKGNIFDKNEKSQFVKKFFVMGFYTAFAFMINIKAILVLAPSFLFILFKIIFEKNLDKNIDINYNKRLKIKYSIYLILCVLISTLLVIIPYIIYMIKTDSMKYMIYNVFTISERYVSTGAAYEYGTSNIFIVIFNYISRHWLFFVFILISLIIVIKCEKQKLLKYYYVVTLIFSIITISLANNGYSYYLVTLYPFFIPFYVFIVNKIKIGKIGILLSLLCSFTLIYVVGYKLVKNQYNTRHNFNMEMKNAVSKYVDLDEIKNKKVLALAFNPEAYMSINARLSFPFFYTVNNRYEVSPSSYNEQLKYMKNKEPDIVIHRPESSFIYFPIPMQEEILDILDTYYIKIAMIDTKSNYGVYEIYLKRY